jgi:hypothetical protein
MGDGSRLESGRADLSQPWAFNSPSFRQKNQFKVQGSKFKVKVYRNPQL